MALEGNRMSLKRLHKLLLNIPKRWSDFGLKSAVIFHCLLIEKTLHRFSLFYRASCVLWRLYRWQFSCSVSSRGHSFSNSTENVGSLLVYVTLTIQSIGWSYYREREPLPCPVFVDWQTEWKWLYWRGHQLNSWSLFVNDCKYGTKPGKIRRRRCLRWRTVRWCKEEKNIVILPFRHSV